MAGLGIWRVGLVAAACALAGASSAMAQSETPPKPVDVAPTAPTPAKPADKARAAAPAKPPTNSHTVDTITVTGSGSQEVETSIDKKSYTLGKDLAATSGSIADALKNLPSVDVDVQGTLSIRGDQNVTILVDGKPSASFNGQGRADALQQLPADQIERVEVITNPSAALNPEGSGGVINLITKTSRGGGVTGSAYVTAASAGLKRAGVNFGYNSPKLSVTGALAGNYQNTKQQATSQRGGIDVTTGLPDANRDVSIGRNLFRGPNARFSATYTPDKDDQITGSASYNELVVQGHPSDHFVDEGTAGFPIGVIDRTGERHALGTETSYTTGWKHTFAAGRELSLDLIYNQALYRDNTLYTTVEELPLAIVPLEAMRADESDHHTEFRAGYSQSLAGGSLKTGYELKRDDNDYDRTDRRGPTAAALAPVDSLANHFAYLQTINAAFATYEHAFGDLSVQAGLRLEELNLRLAQLTSGQRNGQDYAKAYPSLHVAYKLDDNRKLSASFSTRVQRPPPFLLDPILQIIDPKNVQVGNPDLKPEETQSYEFGYEQRQGPATYVATLYYRRKINQLNQIEHELDDGVFEYTFGNTGSNQSAGVELSANGKLTSTLSYSISSNVFWTAINASNLVADTGVESGYAISGRVNLNWQVRPDDMLQFNATDNGKRLIAQGVLLPSYAVNLGWRHKINDRLTATVTVQDLLATSKFQRRLDTPTVFEHLDVAPMARFVFFRLDYRFGGAGAKAAKEPGFEYENGAPAAGPG